ncbi:MAG: diguanylate cyclase [Desulfovermiculus sp.]
MQQVRLSTRLSVYFAVCFLLAGLAILNHRLLFVPLRSMAAKARQIAERKEHLGEGGDIPKGSEMREIAMALNVMSKRLKEHVDDLEGQVQNRTDVLSKVNAMMHQEIHERQKSAQELQKYATQLEYLVRTDELTQAYNRRHFLQELEKEVDRSRRYNRPLSVLVLDLDYFKDVNDTYGHASGDAVLQAVSAACSSTLRAEDIFARPVPAEDVAALFMEQAGE